MERRSRRAVERILAPLLLVLTLGPTAAAPPNTAESALSEIRVLIDRGHDKVAEQKVDAALAAFGKQDSEAVWGHRIYKGWLLHRRNQTTEALAILEPKPPAKYAESETAVRRLYYLGFIIREEPYFAEAIELARTRHPRLLPDALFAGTAGDPKLREQRAREALNAAKRYNRPVVELRIRAGKAQQLANEDRSAEAIQIAEPVVADALKLGYDGLVVQTAGNLGWYYSELGDWERAAHLYEQAAAAAARRGNIHEQVRWLLQLGHLREDMRDYDAAFRYYSEALAVAPSEHPSRGRILRSFGSVATEKGRLDEARRHLARARAHKTVLQDTEADPQLRVDVIEARIHLATGRRDDAEKIFRRIVTEATARDVEWNAKRQLAKLLGEANRDAEAEKLFRELVGSGFEIRRTLKVEQRLSFSNVMNETFDAFTDFLVSRARVEEALNVTESVRARTMEEALKLQASPHPLDAQRLARERNATILSYRLGADRSLVWVVRPSKPMIVYPLPPKIGIEREVDAYQRDLMGARGSLDMVAARSQKLFQMLVDNVAPGIAPGSRVIVVPDGRLHVLNFETLIVAKPQRHYWIEDAIVITASSLELVGRSNGAPRTPRSLLLIGDPPKEDPQFPPLAHAAAEIDLVTSHFSKPSVLRKKNATPASYRNAAPERYDVLHFVAHGVANRLKPLESAVILGSDGDEYKLYAHEIVAKPLNAQLVTISSCHGAGTRTYAEGLVGLAWAFLGAGAENVIAALWEVDDRATPKLMDSLYEGLRAGRDPAVALRDAKLKMVRSKSVYDRARYWAPFVLYSGS